MNRINVHRAAKDSRSIELAGRDRDHRDSHGAARSRRPARAGKRQPDDLPKPPEADRPRVRQLPQSVRRFSAGRLGESGARRVRSEQADGLDVVLPHSSLYREGRRLALAELDAAQHHRGRDVFLPDASTGRSLRRPRRHGLRGQRRRRSWTARSGSSPRPEKPIVRIPPHHRRDLEHDRGCGKAGQHRVVRHRHRRQRMRLLPRLELRLRYLSLLPVRAGQLRASGAIDANLPGNTETHIHLRFSRTRPASSPSSRTARFGTSATTSIRTS